MNLNGEPIIFSFSLKHFLDMSRITCLIVVKLWFPNYIVLALIPCQI